MIKMFKSKYANLPECMSKFDENGVRTETRIRIAHYKTQEEVDALAAEGFVAHTDADFDKYLGNNTDGKTYRYDADTNAPKEYVHVPTVEEVLPGKISAFKTARDSEEVQPIEYNGNLFDYDEKARDRINAAIIALDTQGPEATIDWTTADNKDVPVTANDLRAVIGAVAVRSNTLHVKYRDLKLQAENAKTVEELNAINW